MLRALIDTVTIHPLGPPAAVALAVLVPVAAVVEFRRAR